MTYTCFEHPDEHHGPRELTDACSTCGRPYNHPLQSAPAEIDGYTVEPDGALGRGFFGASFLVRHPLLGHQLVFKVIPVAVYQMMNRDFVEESRRHISAAEGTQHLVPLVDVRGVPSGVPVTFGDTTVLCHIAVLKYVEGETLKRVLTDPRQYGARGSAQIAIDLLRLLDELANRRVHHNDLHADNILIQRLPEDERRGGEVDEMLRAVAIDLGSVGSGDAADPEASRPNDVNRIGSFLRALSAGLLADSQSASDTDYRLAQALEEVAMQMTRPLPALRILDFTESIDLIREAVLFTDAPWREPGSLKRFNAGYNAQLLGASFVSRLLIDPGDIWTGRISQPGPQVITGMRGCGKTMLLKALEVHARINRAQQNSEGQQALLTAELEKDSYVGFYESSDRLLDGLGHTGLGGPLHRPEARLFLAYARNAVHALRHLQNLDPTLAEPLYPERLGRAVAQHLRGGEDVAITRSAVQLEQALHRMLVRLAQGDEEIELPADAGLAFPDLAAAISQSSVLWTDRRVLFLLDDASTRNLAPDNIDHLCSRLLFKHERCAFKIVTEQQALEQLRSPALLEAIQIGRDIDLFDLGGEVNERMRQRGPDGGRSFIGQILEARAHLYEQHPRLLSGELASPEDVLGTATLESIAKQVVAAGDPPVDNHQRTKVTRERLERVYHGLNALSAVCVGDIGDVLAIYDLMLRKAAPDATLPLDSKLQTQAFREYCVRRLWNLNRRKGDLRPYAVSFAKAAHSLLLQSHRRQGARLRQYASIHVQIDPVKGKQQFDAILELIDAGIFVFEGGNYGPRLKRFSGNPKTEFILNYRKLFGLSHYIGLAERDRFELRGEAISEWLDRPDDPIVLTRRLGGRTEQDESPSESAYLLDADWLLADNGEQLALTAPTSFPGESEEQAAKLDEEFIAWRMPRTRPLSDMPDEAVTAIIGRGFEDRTLESVRWLLKHAKLAEAVLIEYSNPGSPKIKKELEEAGIPVRPLPYAQATVETLMPKSGPVIVDVTGLTKSLIFTAVRAALHRDDRVLIAHSQAERHWPLNETLEPILQAHKGEVNLFAVLDDIEQIQTGDEGDYEFVRLLNSGADDGRRRLLSAGASVKHMRLLALLEQREYDRLEILVPDSDTPRSDVARHAAEAARRSAEAAIVQRIAFDDPVLMIDWLGRRYRRWYRHGGFDVEMALSGSKMHAVAAAAVSDAVKIAQCWYVRPTGVNPDAFSEGYKGTELFEILAPTARVERVNLVAAALLSHDEPPEPGPLANILAPAIGDATAD
jgi:hypothetical protein